MLKDEKNKILNFLQDFGCASLRQLQILFNKPKDNFKDLLFCNSISKKKDIFVHNNSKIDKKMLSALDVLCSYKSKLKHYHKGYNPVYITFINNKNFVYNIIVTDKNNEQGVLKLLKTESPIIPEADRFILLFEDKSCYDLIECKTPYIYCVYPNVKRVIKKY